jgi:hypothetical protein
MNITCTWEFALVPSGAVEVIPGDLDRVMNELLALEACTEGLADSAIGLDLESLSAEISVSVEAESPESAIATAVNAIRTAIHAAGGSTAGWPTVTDVVSPGIVFEPRQLTAV